MTPGISDTKKYLDLGHGVPRKHVTPHPPNKEAAKPYDVKLHRTGAAVLLERPCIIGQHEKFPDTVVKGVPQPAVYNLSQSEDLAAYRELLGRVHNADGPTAAILERDRNFFEGAYYVNVIWQPVLYKQIISPKESDYVESTDEESI